MRLAVLLQFGWGNAFAPLVCGPIKYRFQPTARNVRNQLLPVPGNEIIEVMVVLEYGLESADSVQISPDSGAF